MKNKSQAYYLIVGMGRSGLSMAKFLHSKGEAVKATDIDPSKTLAQTELDRLGIDTQVGFHDQAFFDKAHTLVVSPGIPLTVSFIQNAQKKGVKVTGELDIFSQYNTTPVIAVTGTNGKTTTTTLIRDIMAQSGLKVFTGGNIGTPLMAYLLSGDPCDVVVAEISSFQLDLSQNFHPDVAVLLNITDDHLDRYEDFRAYEDSKYSIFKNQTPADAAVINRDMAGYPEKKSTIPSTIYEFSAQSQVASGAAIHENAVTLSMPQISNPDESQIPCGHFTGLQGGHNRENLAAAAIACLCAGACVSGLIRALENFKGLSHRIAFVRELDQIKFYNDSKATNTDAVVRAVQALSEGMDGKKIILILGGREKGLDFAPLVPVVRDRVKLILAIGEASAHVTEDFQSLCPVLTPQDMAQAVQSARSAGEPGDIVLLSPACASFDMYENYEARGRDFTEQVNQLEAIHA